jgi:hypothetical protein
MTKTKVHKICEIFFAARSQLFGSQKKKSDFKPIEIHPEFKKKLSKLMGTLIYMYVHVYSYQYSAPTLGSHSPVSPQFLEASPDPFTHHRPSNLSSQGTATKFSWWFPALGTLVTEPFLHWYSMQWGLKAIQMESGIERWEIISHFTPSWYCFFGATQSGNTIDKPCQFRWVHYVAGAKLRILRSRLRGPHVFY